MPRLISNFLLRLDNTRIEISRVIVFYLFHLDNGFLHRDGNILILTFYRVSFPSITDHEVEKKEKYPFYKYPWYK